MFVNATVQNISKKPACHKNPNNPSWVDLILTNKGKFFQRSCVIETGLSDFHKMTVTALKIRHRNLEPKVVYYRDQKKFIC